MSPAWIPSCFMNNVARKVVEFYLSEKWQPCDYDAVTAGACVDAINGAAISRRRVPMPGGHLLSRHSTTESARR